jgi:hypothetical protein
MQKSSYDFVKRKAPVTIHNSVLIDIYEIAYAVNTLGGHHAHETAVESNIFESNAFESEKINKKRDNSPSHQAGQKFTFATHVINCWPFLSDLQYLP